MEYWCDGKGLLYPTYEFGSIDTSACGINTAACGIDTALGFLIMINQMQHIF